MMDYVKIAATPLLLVAAGLLIIRFRRLSWREDVGFAAPRPVDVIVWVAVFVAAAALAELFAEADPAGSWRDRYSGADLAIRLLAVPLIYPIAEEFFFRGVFLGVIRRRFGTAAAVALPAIMFGLIHVQYDWRAMAFVALDGLIFGIARVRTGSVYVPMLLHVIGNSWAVWERLG
ncbi:MAG: protease family protein [Sphingomonadales bacterium]|jgi:membrane protease YdiL (CAAX protease family)|nr:protease family protein [Sphingomonadales bacterium]